MRRCTIREQADIDLDEIADYIGHRNIDAGNQFMVAASEAFELLLQYPGIGASRPTRRKKLRGLRFWPMTGYRNYLIFYMPVKDGIDIVRVLHGARNITSALFD